MANWQIENKDVMTWCKEYEGPKFHALLADPPYHLTTITKRFGKEDAAPAQYGRDGAFRRMSKGFMGSTWDGEISGVGVAFDPATWAALSEHLLPGAFIFVFGSSRGWHRLAVAIEDAGFVFHPSLMVWGWVNGSGFPKATRINRNSNGHKEWEGHRYGRQALKPAVEMIICAQKPYEGKPVECIVETGAGALFIDGGRVGLDGMENHKTAGRGQGHGSSVYFYPDDKDLNPVQLERLKSGQSPRYESKGRWPPNLCLLHSPDCQRAGTKRVKGSGNHPGGGHGGIWSGDSNIPISPGYADPDGLETVAAWACSEDCAARRIGEQSGNRRSSCGGGTSRNAQVDGIQFTETGNEYQSQQYFDRGSAARFFPQLDWSAEVAERLANSDQVKYQSKASRSERDAGLEEWMQVKNVERYAQRGKCIICERWQEAGEDRCTCGGNYECQSNQHKNNARNPHSTVKPISLVKWLATLLLPPPEYAPRRILIPFAGVMSEAIGAMLAGWEEIVGIEMSEEYCEIGEARLKSWSQFSSYEAAMETARNIQQSQHKQDAQAQSGQLKLTL